MPLTGLPTTTMQIPLAAGLNQKPDERAKQPPALDICVDVEFDDTGGLRTRKPFTSLPLATTTGGNVTDTGALRKIVSNGDELLLFTQTGLYTYVPSANAWALRDTHMAVAVDEDDVFAVNGDQTSIDRAQIGNVVFFAWLNGVQPTLAALDATTGAVILKPTLVDSTGHGANSLRLVVLTTRVLLVLRDFSVAQLKVIAIDPANIAATIPSIATTLGLTITGPFDACRIGATDTALIAIGASTTSYQLSKVTAALAITTVTKARGGDEMIAIAIDPTVTQVQVARAPTSTLNVVGDLLTLATLADVFTGTALGTYVQTGTSQSAHITCAYRTPIVGGFYRCDVFWTDEQQIGNTSTTVLTAWTSYHNFVTTNNVTGAFAAFMPDLGLASRAFTYGGSVYAWFVFSQQTTAGGGVTYPLVALQNTLFLYRDDGLLVAKGAADRAGGMLGLARPSPALPDVQLVFGSTKFAWGGTIRRAIPVGNFLTGGTGYAGRAPCNMAFTFDDDRARRAVRLGKTLYVSGGQVLQYDGVQLAELGFHVYPWDVLSSSGAGGAKAAGAYAVKSTYRSTNAAGELDRSTTATVCLDTGVPASGRLTTLVKPLYYSRKVLTNVTVEGWTTLVNPVLESPFNLSTGTDPAVLGGNNAYVPNDPTVISLTLLDGLSDFDLGKKQANPENGSVLESLAPPAANIIIATDSRIFLADIAGLPNTVWYSKTRNDGEVASFNDALTITIPIEGGAITGLAILNETVVVFRETAIYAFAGEGFDNSSNGSNYGPSRIVSLDCGAVSAEAIATMDDGLLFKSDKGWYHLDRGWVLTYVGGPVVDFDSDEVKATHVVQTQHQVRILTDQRIIVYDYLVNQWGEWTLPGLSSGATMWKGVYVYVDTDDHLVWVQRSDLAIGVNYGFDIETVWIKANDLQGMGRIRKLMALGELRGLNWKLRWRVARDYEYASDGVVSYTDDVLWTPTQTIIGGPVQVKHGPSQQQCESIKVRLTAVALDGVSAPTNDTMKLTGLGARIGVYADDLNTRLSAAQKA